MVHDGICDLTLRSAILSYANALLRTNPSGQARYGTSLHVAVVAVVDDYGNDYVQC